MNGSTRAANPLPRFVCGVFLTRAEVAIDSIHSYVKAKCFEYFAKISWSVVSNRVCKWIDVDDGIVSLCEGIQSPRGLATRRATLTSEANVPK